MKKALMALFLGANFVLMSAGHAALVSFVVEGTVSTVDTPLADEFSVNELFQLSYTFESTTPADAAPRGNRYTFAIKSVSVSIGSYTASGSSGTILVAGGIQGDSSVYTAWALNLSGPTVNGLSLTPGGTLIDMFGPLVPLFPDSNFALPLEPLELSLFTSSRLELLFDDGADNISKVVADVSSMEFAPVPIPAAVWLFGSGLLGLIGMARRKEM